MDEHITGSWTLALDVTIFALALLGTLLYFGASKRYLDASVQASNTGTVGVTRGIGEYDGKLEVYTIDGMNTAYCLADNGEYVTCEGVYQELLRLPYTIETIRIDGSVYTNGAEEESGAVMEKDLSWCLENGMEETVYSWIGSGELYKKEYDLDSFGYPISIHYETYTAS